MSSTTPPQQQYRPVDTRSPELKHLHLDLQNLERSRLTLLSVLGDLSKQPYSSRLRSGLVTERKYAQSLAARICSDLSHAQEQVPAEDLLELSNLYKKILESLRQVFMMTEQYVPEGATILEPVPNSDSLVEVESTEVRAIKNSRWLTSSEKEHYEERALLEEHKRRHQQIQELGEMIEAVAEMQKDLAQLVKTQDVDLTESEEHIRAAKESVEAAKVQLEKARKIQHSRRLMAGTALGGVLGAAVGGPAGLIIGSKVAAVACGVGAAVVGAAVAGGATAVANNIDRK